MFPKEEVRVREAPRAKATGPRKRKGDEVSVVIGKERKDRTKREREAGLTIRITCARRRVRETPQIQHLAHGQVEEPSCVLGDGQLREIRGVGGRQFALGDIRVSIRDIVVVVAREPGVDGASGDETDVDGDRGRDADFETACCAHGVGGVQDVSKGLEC